MIQNILYVVVMVGLVYGVPISLHPENPHYFLYNGKPAILIGSTEHYGAVMNLDFDYVTYLATLNKDGLTQTRTWTGTYREFNMTFGILNNTIAPAPRRYIAPWSRSSECCYKDGGNKFNLTSWDEAYFSRLKDFLAVAEQYGIIVNLGLFCRMYSEELWTLSPMNSINNVNNVGANLGPDQVYTLKDASLISIMKAVTVKIVTEVNAFDNVYFEVINEPNDNVTNEWTDLIISTIVEVESKLPQKHMIAQNSLHMNPATSLYSFHYGTPNDVKSVYSWNKAIGDGETGFAGPYDYAYRSQGWQWFTSGGATFDNLDYSWTVDHPDGSACCPVVGPSGGGPSLRKQLAILLHFIQDFDFVHMTPDTSIISGYTPNTAWVGVLAHKEKAQFAIYINKTNSISLDVQLPIGIMYEAVWINTLSGGVMKLESFSGGKFTLSSPNFAASGDIALSIRKISGKKA